MDLEVRTAGRGTEQLDAFADIVDAWAAGAPMSRDVTAPLGYLEAAESVEDGLPCRCDCRRRCRRPPRAGAHRARRQGTGMADRGGASSVGPGVPVHRDGAHLVVRRRRAASAAARRPGRRSGRWPARRAGADLSAVTDRKQLSDSITGHRDQPVRRRLDEERRLRTSPSPGPRTRCCCPGTTGVPPASRRAGRRNSCSRSATSSTVPRPRARSTSGHPIRPMVS